MKEMSRFEQHLVMMHEIHERKSKDYSTGDDRFVNYHRQRTLMDWFTNPQDKVYAARIAEKLSRLATLRNKEHDADNKGHDRPTAANEPLVDSFLDLCTISNIWWSDYEGGYRAATAGSRNEAGVQTASQGIPTPEGGKLHDERREAGVGDRSAAREEAASRGTATQAPIRSGQVAVWFVDVIRQKPFTSYELDWIAEEINRARKAR